MAIGLTPHNVEYALRGLAENPSIDVEALVALSSSRDWQTLRVLAARPGLPVELAVVLARHDMVGVRTELACNADVAMRVWMLLADDPDPAVRAALAGGRGGTMSDPGLVVGREPDPPLPDEAGLLLAASPDPTVRLALARRDTLSPTVFWVLDADESPEVREAVAGKLADPPADLLRRWLTDPAVRHGILRQHVPPADLVPELLADPDCAIRTTVASRAVLDRDTAVACAACDDPQMRRAVAGNPAAPLAAVLPLADDPDPAVRTVLMLRPDLPERLRQDIAATVEPLDDRSVAHWLLPENAPLAARLAHARSPLPFIRRAVARSRDLPPAVAARLLADEDLSVRVSMAIHHRDTPADTLAGLAAATDSTPDVRRLLEHPNFPPGALVDEYANAARDTDRVMAATHPRLPAEAAARLVHDPSSWLRGYLAMNPALPPDLVAAMLADPDPYVARAAAGNPALPGWAAQELLDAAARSGLLPAGRPAGV